MDLEDEAFNEIERQSKWRKESVRVALNPYRDQVIEEIAQHVQKMTVFGKDTVDSFAIYIRSLK
jgi:CHASE3 domain sensor protein